MAGPKIVPRAMESTTTTGTGTLTLAGAVTGFQSFAVVGNGNSVFYAVWAVDSSGNPSGDWEEGIGTYTASGTTLSRTTIIASSNGGAAVNFAAGTKYAAGVMTDDMSNRFTHPTDTFANLTAYQAGRLSFPSDGFSLYRDSGSLNVPWGPLFPFTAPINGDFSDIGSPTVSTTNGSIVISSASNGGNWSHKGRKKTAPSTPYTIVAAALLCGTPTSSGIGEAGISFSDGTKYAALLIQGSGAGTLTLEVDNMTTATAISAAPFSSPFTSRSGPIIFLAICDNGTDRKYGFSMNGQTWLTAYTIGRTSFLTATQVGMFVNAYNTPTNATFLHWKEYASDLLP